MKRFALLLAFAISAMPAGAQFVDLGESYAFVRTGFDDAWTMTLPGLGDSDWLRLDPTHNERILEARLWGLPGVPRGGKFSFMPQAAMDLTVLFPFKADLTLLNASDPALYLPQVGQAWAVYLNGVLIRSELIRSGSGYVERSLRGVVVPLDKRRLANGTNILAFRLNGDPIDDRTGFNLKGGYVIDSYRALASRNREYIDLMLIGVYAFFALYHCVLFALRPREKGYLYFGASTLLLAVYMLSRTNLAPTIVANTATIRRVEYLSLFFALPAIIAFLESLLWNRVSVFTIALAGIAAAMSVAGLALRLEPMLYIYYFVIFVSLAYYLVFSLGSAVVRDLKLARSAGGTPGAAAGTGAKLRAVIGRVLLHDDSGKLALASVILCVSASFDMKAIASGGVVIWSKFGFFFFILLTASVLAGQFARVSARAEAMNAGLEREVETSTAELSAAASEGVRLNERLSGANALLVDAMNEAERDMRIAATVQKGFFPLKPPSTRDWDCAHAFEQASGVSGDFFDYYEGGGSLSGAVVGTVSGSGIASGLVTVLAKNVFSRRFSEGAEDTLGARILDINRELLRELSATDTMVSCAILKFDGYRVEYVNAAHSDAVVRRAGGASAVAVRSKDGAKKIPPLGKQDISGSVGALGFSMASGDALMLYSEGIIACVNGKGEAYGAERLATAFARADPDNAESLLTSVMIDFRNYVAGAKRPADIVAMVLLKR